MHSTSLQQPRNCSQFRAKTHAQHSRMLTPPGGHTSSQPWQHTLLYLRPPCSDRLAVHSYHQSTSACTSGWGWAAHCCGTWKSSGWEVSWTVNVFSQSGSLPQKGQWVAHHVMTGGEAAMTLHLKLATPPSWTIQLCGFLTNLGIASRRSAVCTNLVKFTHFAYQGENKEATLHRTWGNGKTDLQRCPYQSMCQRSGFLLVGVSSGNWSWQCGQWQAWEWASQPMGKQRHSFTWSMYHHEMFCRW